MSYIETHTGNHVDLAAPRTHTISIIDIAHALSHINRFTGHTPEAYSVAQHSVMASHLVPPHLALEALLHDATEAYLGDVSSPLKAMLPDYQRIEAQLDMVIRLKFGLPAEMSPDVKHADLVMLATEKRDLLRSTDHWPLLDGIEPMKSPIYAWHAQIARTIFLTRFRELTK